MANLLFILGTCWIPCIMDNLLFILGTVESSVSWLTYCLYWVAVESPVSWLTYCLYWVSVESPVSWLTHCLLYWVLLNPPVLWLKHCLLMNCRVPCIMADSGLSGLRRGRCHWNISGYPSYQAAYRMSSEMVPGLTASSQQVSRGQYNSFDVLPELNNLTLVLSTKRRRETWCFSIVNWAGYWTINCVTGDVRHHDTHVTSL